MLRLRGLAVQRSCVVAAPHPVVSCMRMFSTINRPSMVTAAASPAASAVRGAVAKVPNPTEGGVADASKPAEARASDTNWEQWQTAKKEVSQLYEQVDLNLYPLKSAEFFSDVWKANYEADKSLKRALRSLIAQNTFHVTKVLNYNTTLPGEEKVLNVSLSIPLVKQTLRNTKIYESSAGIVQQPVDTGAAADIRVLNADPLDCAYDLKRAGHNPLVLDPASAVSGSLWMRGGGSTAGAADGTSGTDEDFYRRTTLSRAIKRNQFPLTDSGAAYAPNVIVFRSGLNGGYRLLAEPYAVSIAAIEQYRKPKMRKHDDGSWQLYQPHVLGLKRKFRTFLRLAKHYKHDAIVLPAFGGGIFKNPPRHVASIWKAVFEETEFVGQLPRVRFALTDDFAVRENWQPDGTLRPYLEVFGSSTGYVPPAQFTLPK